MTQPAFAAATVPVRGTPAWIAYRDRKLEQWEQSKLNLDAAKEAEMSLRKEVAELNFPNPERGTQRTELANGYNLKLVHKVNFSFTDNSEVSDALDRIAALGNEGKFIAERLVKWTPSLSLTEYNTLDTSQDLQAKAKAWIDAVIVQSAGAPTLTIEEPKARKR